MSRVTVMMTFGIFLIRNPGPAPLRSPVPLPAERQVVSAIARMHFVASDAAVGTQSSSLSGILHTLPRAIGILTDVVMITIIIKIYNFHTRGLIAAAHCPS
jgi:hypothetical protein